jgi:AcrR family transcriptional regulator
MTERRTTDARRTQIVQTALSLLADTPIDRLTTRQIAEQVGISQPALFRHFRSRGEILEEVVDHTREALARVVGEVLKHDGTMAGRLHGLARGLFEHAAMHPGLLRLLFHHAAGDDAPFQNRLAHLVAMQRALAEEIVRSGQASGEVPAEVDAAQGAALFLALVQGTLLQWQLSGRTLSLEGAPERVVAFWEAAVAGGQPPGLGETEEVLGRTQGALPDIAVLDVRPLLAQGIEPFHDIQDHLRRLPSGGLLRIIAPFRPTPLVQVLGEQGYRVNASERADGHWDLEVVERDTPEVEDLRDLPAPEPMERVLVATASLAPDGVYLARVPRRPNLLLPSLERRGLEWTIHEESDGSVLLSVRRSA